jgi:hypothetical protein
MNIRCTEVHQDHLVKNTNRPIHPFILNEARTLYPEGSKWRNISNVVRSILELPVNGQLSKGVHTAGTLVACSRRDKMRTLMDLELFPRQEKVQ